MTKVPQNHDKTPFWCEKNDVKFAHVIFFSYLCGVIEKLFNPSKDQNEKILLALRSHDALPADDAGRYQSAHDR
jgi:hypothetical protein